ncbi:MAG: O-antigen ligase domain-containing protein [Cyanothece sp. SIO1E1]|nr:O-antigen ligase domain-containing protein [Cyanothece sp. SIO1E1]
MSPVVYLAMFGWIPVVLYLFQQLPAQRAVIVSFITAWLFLPVASFVLPGIPDLTKMSATCYGILLATIIYDVGRFKLFRFGWLDLPMLIWCLCPFASSLSNDLGPYDGFSEALKQTVTWGLPYFLGRIYLNNLVGLRQLAIGIFVGGLIYVPLCLFEVRMSPQLHRIVYGAYARAGQFAQAFRYGGWRPTVFMNHGLQVAFWMMATALIGICLWKTGVLKELWTIRVKWLISALLMTVLLLKSTGVWILFGVGLVILFIAWQLRTAFTIVFLIGCMFIYLYQNTLTETYVTDQIISSLQEIISPERIESLEFRFNSEELLADHARDRIIFGWGGWQRSLVFDDFGRRLATQDSLWIIAFGTNGLVGLVSLYLSMLLPSMILVLRFQEGSWSKRETSPAAVLALVVTLYMMDGLLNAMINPIFALTCGGISGLMMVEKKSLKSNRTSSSLSTRLTPVHQNHYRNS